MEGWAQGWGSQDEAWGCLSMEYSGEEVEKEMKVVVRREPWMEERAEA